MAEDLSSLAERDLEFIRDVCDATDAELATMHRWQSQERWRRMAIEREMAKRSGKKMPHSIED